ncbi:MAG: hypothetical protein MUF03_14035 [Rubrivivax sp.]|jgi:protein-S-isoprenylcysteine O-methyltransferase Ste14|nr:hypothetical protein [Rubrivivax sp.]
MNAAATGRALVAAQFAGIGVLGWVAGPAFLGFAAPWPAWTLAGAGAALGAWALASNRPGNFNIRPVPKPGGQLVEHGPYRWIRHPMYSAVLLFALAAVLAAPGPVSWVAALALAVVLWVKAGVEERAMGAAHPGYAAYRARTRRFVPGLF